jgi:hypothetical protein
VQQFGLRQATQRFGKQRTNAARAVRSSVREPITLGLGLDDLNQCSPLTERRKFRPPNDANT